MCILCSSSLLNAVDGTHGLVGGAAGEHAPSTIELGAAIEDLEIGTSVGGTFADGGSSLYEIDLDAGDAIALDLKGQHGDTDATLSLFDAEGRLLGQQQGGDTLTFVADTEGPVYVRVDTAAGPGVQAGELELLVSETNASGHATLDTLSAFLTTGYWSTPQKWNLGDDGYFAKSGQLTYSVTGFSGDSNGLSAARQDLVREAFKIYEAVLGIDFVETGGDADFRFSDNSSGAYASSAYSVVNGQGLISYSNINVQSSWYGSSSAVDGYTFQTILHEIGHALGLGHQGSYNGSASYGSSNDFANDSWQGTMMSYFSQTENTSIDASYAFLLSPMAVDWIALDSLYGEYGFTSANAFTGDTVWGFNSNVASSVSDPWSALSDYADNMAFTIVDGGGTDTVDFSGYYQNQRIDLTITEGSFTQATTSDIGNEIGNMTLAVGTVIENAISGSGNDELIGNEADNVLNGGAGDDVLTGGAGDDDLIGGDGQDFAVFANAYDFYSFSQAGDHWVVLGEGTDRVFDSVEMLSFADQDVAFGDIAGTGPAPDPTPVVVAPDARDDAANVDEDGTVTLDLFADNGAGADSDTDGAAFQITELAGAATGPVTLASGAVVTFSATGILTFDTNGAFDALSAGQTATESFAYTIETNDGRSDTATVTITIDGRDDLLVQTGTNARDELSGTEQGDTISGLDDRDSLWGMGADDVLYGDGGRDKLYGGAGSDMLDGGADADRLYGDAGDDILLGGDGADRLEGGDGADTLDGNDGNDKLDGGEGNDIVTDTLGNNDLRGGGGEDVITGGAGRDRLRGDDGDDTLTGGGGRDNLNGGDGDDQLEGGDDRDVLAGRDGDDLLFGGADADVLRGDRGADQLYGGDGNDRLSGGSENDRLEGAEGDDRLDGGRGDDILLAGSGDNRLAGGAGNDELVAEDGDDRLDGGNGDDHLTAGGGTDRLKGGAGDDALFGGDGDDDLRGGDGNDLLVGGTGADALRGDRGVDIASYADSAGSVTASLADNSLNRGDAAGDSYRTIEGLEGSDHDDMLGGDGRDNVFTGGAGADQFVFAHAGFGADFGADVVTDWQDGIDLLDFSAAGLGISDFSVVTVGTDIILTLTADADNQVTLQGAAGSVIDALDFA